MFNLQQASILKAQPRQRISNIYIYLYVSDKSEYTGLADDIPPQVKILNGYPHSNALENKDGENVVYCAAIVQAAASCMNPLACCIKPLVSQ